MLNSISIVTEYKDCNNESNKNKIDKLNKLNNELIHCNDPDKSNFLYKKILDLFDRLNAGIFSPLFNEATHKASMLEKKERIEQINRLGIANKLLLLQDQFEKIILLIEKDLPDEDGLRNLFMQNYLLVNIELKTTPFKTTDLNLSLANYAARAS